MNRTDRDPTILIFSGFILALVPALLFLMNQYADSHRASPPFVLAPDRGQLLELVQQRASIGEEVTLKPVYTATPEPATGIVTVYDLEHEREELYRLIVFRHDIACSTCRDILAAGLYDIQADTLIQVFLLDPWEVREGPVDTRSFLEQFIGKPAQTVFQLGKGVDGITGATLSTIGLIAQLNEAATWIAHHSVEGQSTQ